MYRAIMAISVKQLLDSRRTWCRLGISCAPFPGIVCGVEEEATFVDDPATAPDIVDPDFRPGLCVGLPG